MEDILYETFYEVERKHWWCVARRDILDAVVSQEVPAGAKLLDIGCGTGFFLETMGDRYEGWGLDQSELAVSMCRERGLSNVHVGSALDVSAVGDQVFDAVTLFDVLEHLEDEAVAMENVRRALKPGGHLIVTVPAFMWLWSKHDDVSQHKRRYVRQQLADVLTRASFTIEKLTYFNAYLFPLAVARRVGRRLTNTDDGVEFKIPADPLNRFLTASFRAEIPAIVRATSRGSFPIGLSLLAVVRAPN
jgi:2-polyprenyl-3-methyl-5-hydroxy-6-metoxy-1,4-benzoquinol methylase